MSQSSAGIDPVTLAKRMIAIDSTSGSEGDMVGFVQSLLSARGWNTERIPVSAGRDDLLATYTSKSGVTLSTHLDTVPPYIPPRLEDGVLYGRGACDAKGIAAAMICAAERLRGAGVPAALLLVVGEETAHDGARAANSWPTRSLVLINGEPTEGKLAVGTKGALRLRIRTKGRAAHSAYPELGESATSKLVHLLAELDSLDLPRDELLGETTVNIGSMSGGVADNVVAPWAEARLMVRLVTPAETIMTMLRQWCAGRAELDLGEIVPPVRLGTLPGFETGVVAYATDVPVLSNWGVPYLYGPGSIHVAHTDNEHVSAADLIAAVDAYERIALTALERH